MTLHLGFGLISCQRLDGADTPWTAIYDDALALTEAAEGAGFDSAWVTEHHLTTDGYLSALLPLLGAMAARTRRIRLGTNVLLAPLHHPLRLAEDAAAVDVVSHGRLILGLGIGYRDEEFDAFGVPKAERVPRLAEHVATCRAAWTGEPFAFRGRDIVCRPAPPGPPPIWLGAWVDEGIRRAARLGDGYISPGGGYDDTVRRVRILDEAAAAAGRAEAVPVATAHAVWVGEDLPDSVRAGAAHLRRHYGDWYGSSSDAGGGRDVAAWIRAREDPVAGIVRGKAEAVVERLAPLVEHLAGREHHAVLRVHWPGVPRSAAVEQLAAVAEEVAPALRRLSL